MQLCLIGLKWDLTRKPRLASNLKSPCFSFPVAWLSGKHPMASMTFNSDYFFYVSEQYPLMYSVDRPSAGLFSTVLWVQEKICPGWFDLLLHCGMWGGVSDRCQEVSANTPFSLNLSNIIEAALRSNILELHFVCPVGNVLASQKSPFSDAVFRGTDLLEKSKTKSKLISLLLK